MELDHHDSADGMWPEMMTLEEARRSADDWIDALRDGSVPLPQTLLTNIAVFPGLVSIRGRRFYHQAPPIRLPLAVVLPS